MSVVRYTYTLIFKDDIPSSRIDAVSEQLMILEEENGEIISEINPIDENFPYILQTIKDFRDMDIFYRLKGFVENNYDAVNRLEVQFGDPEESSQSFLKLTPSQRI